MKQAHLPENCYSSRNMETVLGATIHHISAVNIEPLLPFDNTLITGILEKYKVSYHVLIKRNGERVELIPENKKAYHAGKSRFQGLDNCNSFLKGVVLVGGVKWPYTDEQMISLAEWLGQQMTQHNFTSDWVVGHNTIRDNWNDEYPDKKASKKYDPSKDFNWEILNDMLFSVSQAVENNNA